MPHSIEFSTLRILNSSGKTVGTGFLVAPNLAVTCAHVVTQAGATDGDTIQVQFTGKSEKNNAIVLPGFWSDTSKHDIAILRLEQVPKEITHLPLGPATDCQPGGAFYSFGYTGAAEESGLGTVGKIITLAPGSKFLQLYSEEAYKGMSGAPVYDEQRKTVVGMINKGHIEHQFSLELKTLSEKGFRGTLTGDMRTGITYAIPTETIWQICPIIFPTEHVPFKSESADNNALAESRKSNSTSLPQNSRIPAESNQLNDAINILIVTVTKVEAEAVHQAFSAPNGTGWVRKTVGKRIYYDLGMHGKAHVFMVQSEMGTATPGGSLVTVSKAITDLKPKAIIMCGIAFGAQPDKQKIGDILISKQLEYYEPSKIDRRRGQIPRGDRVTASGFLLGFFRSADLDWKGPKVHFGLVLSGEKLVNDPVFRKRLLKNASEAIGGEMEGAGLYVAARDAGVDWILVKAICDWADGNKDDSAQFLAATQAANFVLHAVQLGWGDDQNGSSRPFVSQNEKLPQNRKSKPFPPKRPLKPIRKNFDHVLLKWWMGRKYKFNPFRYYRASEIPEEDAGELFEKWYTHPHKEDSTLFDLLTTTTNTNPILVYGSSGSGKTFYSRFSSNYMREEADCESVRIFNLEGEFTNINNIKTVDFAKCIYKNLNRHFKIEVDFEANNPAKIITDCNWAISQLMPSKKVFVFIDDVDQLFGVDHKKIFDNQAIYDKLVEFLSVLAKRDGSDALVFRVFIPAALEIHLRKSLQPYNHKLEQHSIHWTVSQCWEVVQQRLAEKKNVAKDLLPRLLATDSFDRLDIYWGKNIENLSPGCVLKTLHSLTVYACKNGVKNEPIKLEICEKFLAEASERTMCSPKLSYPLVDEQGET